MPDTSLAPAAIVPRTSTHLEPLAVPLVDLPLQNARVGSATRAAIERVTRDSAFVLGPDVDAFERDYARYCGTAHAIGAGNGTDALELCLRAAGIGAGDEVILPTNSFVATAEAVALAGAQPVFADVDDAHLIDPDDVGDLITSRTRAVIGVDLYGQCAPFDRLRAVVGDDIRLIEDAAQSHGARRHGASAGSLADLAATSFYPGKNLGAFGDAGAVTTDDASLALTVRQLGNHGGTGRYEHRVLGRNSRLDGLQAAVLRVKLEVLDEWNAERQRAARLYERLLGEALGAEVTPPRIAAGNTHVFHLYVVQTPHRDRVRSQLAAAGIATGVHYPTPIHRQPAFASLPGAARTLPVAERAAGRSLSLPMFPGITSPQQHRVVEALAAALSPASAAAGVAS